MLFRLQIYLLHSTVILEEQNGVFQLPVPGYRKVKTINHILPCVLPTCCADNLLILPGHPFHQHCWEFVDCSRCQIWLVSLVLSVSLVSMFYSSFIKILTDIDVFVFLFFVLLLSQWLTSAWPVTMSVTKTPIISPCVSPGHPKPIATSVEVQYSCHRACKVSIYLFFSPSTLISLPCQVGQVECRRATVTVWLPESSGRMKSLTTWSPRCR